MASTDTTTDTIYTLRTRSTHAFALVAFDKGAPEGPYGIRPIVGARIVGYAASNGPRVLARCRRERCRLYPIIDGRVTVRP